MAVRVPIGAWGAEDPDDVENSGPSTDQIDELLEDGAFLHAFCERILGDPSAAEDVVQETYLYAVTNLGRLERRGSYAPWLATVARRRSANEVRRRVRVDLVPQMPDEPSYADDDPADAAITQDTLERARAALDELSPRERDLLERQVFDGLSISELVGIDNSTAASVKSVLNRARAKVRAAVEDAGTRVLAPVAGLVATLRRHLTNASAKLQQGGPVAPASIERAGEAITAAVATLVLGTSVAAPAADTPAPAVDTTSSRPVATVHPSVEPAGGAVAPTRADDALAPASEPDAGVAAPVAPGPDASDDVPSEPDDDPSAPGLPPTPSEPPVNPEEPVKPPAEADEPEDASFSSFGSASSGGQVSSSGAGDEGTSSPHVFGLGVVTGHCRSDCTVLFRSADAGATWERAAADGLGDATSLLVAPGYPDDPRIYAMGPTGLRLSEDSGETFRQVDQPHEGPATMSPGFSGDDERILIGASPSWVYDAEADDTTPIAAAPLAGRYNRFAFAPDAAETGVFFAASTAPGAKGPNTPVVHRCHESTCDQTTELSVGQGVPGLTVALGPDGEMVVLAWKGRALFRSVDEGASFELVDPGVDGTIKSVVQTDRGTLFLTWAGADDTGPIGGILRSDDGLGWERVTPHAALERGVETLHALPGGKLLAAPPRHVGGGLFCSADDGVTWSPRCP